MADIYELINQLYGEERKIALRNAGITEDQLQEHIKKQ